MFEKRSTSEREAIHILPIFSQNLLVMTVPGYYQYGTLVLEIELPRSLAGFEWRHFEFEMYNFRVLRRVKEQGGEKRGCAILNKTILPFLAIFTGNMDSSHIIIKNIKKLSKLKDYYEPNQFLSSW